jgi:acetyl esterase/lipase
MTVRVYAPGTSTPRPVLVCLHGGSFTRGTLDTFDAARRSLANQSGCTIVAVDQRLAPEALFPAPVNDAYAATRWAVAHTNELGGDPDLIGIGGESSGANLAAATTILARRRGGPPSPARYWSFPFSMPPAPRRRSPNTGKGSGSRPGSWPGRMRPMRQPSRATNRSYHRCTNPTSPASRPPS